MTAEKIEILPLGEAAVTVEFGKRIHPDIHLKVQAFAEYLESNDFPWLLEYISAFSSVTVFYDPLLIKASYSARGNLLASEIVADLLRSYAAKLDTKKQHSPRIVRIPVCYGGEYGPDLAFVAQHNGLSTKEVIEIHTKGEYLVYMIGFAPGFPYLGGMSEKIAAPRRSSPRLAIPARTVGIAGLQTGVYPIETPGGWQLIGRTPSELFLPEENPPSLLKSGDVVKFYAVSQEEYEEIRGKKK